MYCKNNLIGEEISKKLLSKDGIWINSFLLAIEALTQWSGSKLYYSEFKLQDTLKLLLYILKADIDNPDMYFENNSIRDLEMITYYEARNLFNLLYNFLNNTSDKDYSPFSFTKSIFEFDNKDNEDVNQWEMRYDSFKFQLKCTVPFTVKFCWKYIEAQTMYNLNYITTDSGEKLWSDSSLATKITKIPSIQDELREKINILNDEIWCTLFLSLPRLEMYKDIDLIYNSGSDGLSFNRLAYAIIGKNFNFVKNLTIGYKGPFIILIRHTNSPRDNDEENKEDYDNQEYVLGVYIDSEVKDNAKYGGNLNCCIFWLSPQFKVMRTINNKGGTNYVYLNTVKIENSEIVYGMAFGGNLKEPRLWLDGDDLTEK